MDGADLPSHSAAATAADGDRPPESAGDGGVEDEGTAAPPPEHSVATAADGDRPTESAGHGGVEDERAAAPPPEHSSAKNADGDRAPESAGDGGVEDEQGTAPPPERCEALASAIAGVLSGALREHEERAAATARSQDEVAAAVVRLNGELDRLLENAPSMVIMQHSARISSIRKRISAMNMLLKSIQRRIDNIDRIISTDHSSPVQKAVNDVGSRF